MIKGIWNFRCLLFWAFLTSGKKKHWNSLFRKTVVIILFKLYNAFLAQKWQKLHIYFSQIIYFFSNMLIINDLYFKKSWKISFTFWSFNSVLRNFCLWVFPKKSWLKQLLVTLHNRVITGSRQAYVWELLDKSGIFLRVPPSGSQCSSKTHWWFRLR